MLKIRPARGSMQARAWSPSQDFETTQQLWTSDFGEEHMQKASEAPYLQAPLSLGCDLSLRILFGPKKEPLSWTRSSCISCLSWDPEVGYITTC